MPNVNTNNTGEKHGNNRLYSPNNLSFRHERKLLRDAVDACRPVGETPWLSLPWRTFSSPRLWRLLLWGLSMIYEITMMKTAKFLVEAYNEVAAEQQASDWCIEALDASDNISFVGEGIEEISLHDAISKYGQFHRPINTLRSLDEILRPEVAV